MNSRIMPLKRIEVLNALRHQRVGSGQHARLLDTAYTLVLNALRHQRVGSGGADRHYPLMKTNECSTPYGIRGLDQQPNPRPVHEKRHKCSTPYGIRGLDQYKLGPDVRNQAECSTPYGIRGLDQLFTFRHGFSLR